MTKVTIVKKNFKIFSVECDGHTNYGEKGEDIVCASLSSIVQTAVLGLLVVATLELDMKKAARSVGEKSVELLHVKDITSVTGYVRGGCTPIGMKKQFMTVVHNSAAELDSFYISGGRIGTQIELSPLKLVEAIHGKFEDIVLEAQIPL